MMILKCRGVDGDGGVEQFLLSRIENRVEFLHVECKIIAELLVACAGFLNWTPSNIFVDPLYKFGVDTNRASNDGHDILRESTSFVCANNGGIGHGFA